jgi:hypothetical protein
MGEKTDSSHALGARSQARGLQGTVSTLPTITHAYAPRLLLCLRLPVFHVSSQHLECHVSIQLKVCRVSTHAVRSQHAHCCGPVALPYQQHGVAGCCG